MHLASESKRGCLKREEDKSYRGLWLADNVCDVFGFMCDIVRFFALFPRPCCVSPADGYRAHAGKASGSDIDG